MQRSGFKAVVCLLGTLGVIGCTRSHGEQGNKGPGASEGRPIPVLASEATLRDVPLYLYGLGSVAAYNTVTVKTQIAGYISRIVFTEGQVVHKGDLLVQIDPRPYEILLAQGEAALARDTATLHNDRLNLDRDIGLRKENLVAPQIVDNQQALVNQDEATVLSDQATIETAKLDLVYCRIVSPIQGVTGIRQVDVGNYVQPSDTTGIVILTQLEPIAVTFTLPQDDLTRIQKQMALRPLTAEAFTRDGLSDSGSGQVLLIDNQINQNTGTIRLKAIFENPHHALWPLQFVKVRLLLTVRKNSLVVPASAVQHGTDGTFAYVVGADNKVATRHLEVASIEGDLALLTHGLEPGEKVVTDGQYQLRPGMRVVVRSPQGPASDAGSSNPIPGPGP